MPCRYIYWRGFNDWAFAPASRLSPWLDSRSDRAGLLAPRLRGFVVSLDGSTLVVHAKDGKDVSINLGDELAVLAVVN